MSQVANKVSTWIGLMARGLIMGVAEVLPGISGGTIALITGIYERLVDALADIVVWAKDLVVKRSFAFEKLIPSLSVLVPLVIGMAIGLTIAIFSIVHLKETYPLLVWGAIFGIVVGAVVYTGMSSQLRYLLMFAPIGLVLALAMTLLPGRETEASLWMVFVGAVFAFVAWILPGVSGSFVLLIMGVWSTVLDAFVEFNILTLLVFVVGLKLGCIIVVHPIRVVLKGHKEGLMALFSGLLIGSTWRIWPWQMDGNPTLPWEFSGDPMVVPVVTVMLMGMFTVMVLTYAKVRKTA